VQGERKVEVKPNDHLTIGQSQHIQLGDKLLTKAGREIHLKAGQKMVIEAGSEITLTAGGSFIKIDAGGVTLVGPMAKLNAGGSPGSGSGAAPLMPVNAHAADSDEAGSILAPLPKRLSDSGITPLCGKQSNGACSRGDCPCLKG